MVDGQGDLEDQLAEVKKKSAEIADRKEDLRIIEDLGAQMEEALILDNKWALLWVLLTFDYYSFQDALFLYVASWASLY